MTELDAPEALGCRPVRRSPRTAPRVSTSTTLAAIACTLLATVALVMLLFMSTGYEGARLAYGALALLCICIVGVELGRWGRIGIISPLSCTMAGFLYFFCYIPLSHPQATPEIYSDSKRYIPLAWTVGLSIVVYVAGFVVAPTLRSVRVDRWISTPLSSRRLMLNTMLLLGLYLGLQTYLSRSAGIGLTDMALNSRYDLTGETKAVAATQDFGYYLNQICRWLPIGIVPPLAFCLLQRRTNGLVRLLLAVSMAACVIFALGSGIRYVLAYVLGSVAAVFLLGGHFLSRTVRGTAYGALALAATAFVLSAIQVNIRGSGGLQSLLSGTRELDVFTALETTGSEIGADQNYSLEAVLIGEETGTVQHVWGETYALTFVMLIPRRIWLGKPGTKIMDTQRTVNPFSVDNVSYSMLGELSLNFGLPFILPGTMLLGWLAGVWWHFARRGLNRPPMLILYAMSVTAFAFMVRGSFATMFGALMYPSILTILLLQSARRRGHFDEQKALHLQFSGTGYQRAIGRGEH